MDLSAAIDAYLLYRARDNKPSTVRQDKVTLQSFLTHVGNIQIHRITLDHVEDYFYGPDGRVRRDAPATFNANLGRLRVFFAWARDEGHVKQDVMRRLRRRKGAKRDRQHLTPAEMLAAIDTLTYPRDRAMLALACNTGMRVSSVTELRIADIYLDDGYLVMTNVKAGGRQRRLPITADLDKELRAWFTYYAQECVHMLRPGATTRYGLDVDWYVTPARWRGGLARDERGRIITHDADHGSQLRPTVKDTHPARIAKKALENIGKYETYEGFHTFRRSVGRAVYDQAANAGDARAIYIAQNILDHDDARTTWGYIGSSHEQETLHELLKGKSFLDVPTDSGNVASLDQWRKRRGS